MAPLFAIKPKIEETLPMTAILNLDDLLKKDESFVMLKGKKHVISELSLGTFLYVADFVEKLSTAGSMVEEIKMTMDIIIRVIPSISREDLELLTGPQLTALRQIVTNGGVVVQETEGAAAGAEGNDQPA